MVNKIYLVNAGNEESISSITNDGTFPALGVLSLATAVKTSVPEVEVNVDDGQVTELETIEEKIRKDKPDVVGVSVLATSYNPALKLAKAAKEIGATVIFGNDQAAIYGKNMLRNREEIDYISAADVGELAFVEFVKFLRGERKAEEVPQLVYRTSEGITQNNLPELLPSNRFSILDQIPIPDRNLFSQKTWYTYLANYLERYGNLHQKGEVKGVTTINRARGCARVKDPCSYCGIKDLSLRFSSPEVFWQEVQEAKRQIGANIFYEAFDSFSSAPVWIRKLVEAKPERTKDTKFSVYSQASELSSELIELYRKLGVYRVNIGLDSGDETMVKRLKGPRDSVEEAKPKLLELRDNGIDVYTSFVLGAPGETHETLENTIRFAEWLVDNEIVAAIEAQPLYPEINAKAGRWLTQPEQAELAAQQLGFEILDRDLLSQMAEKMLNSESPDTDEFCRYWAQIFSNVKFDELVQYAKRIRTVASDAGVVSGSGLYREEPQSKLEPGR